MIKRNNAERPGPHGVAIASQYIYFPCVMSRLVNELGVEVRSELSVLVTSLTGRKPRYIFAFSDPMDRSCSWHVHKP